MSACNTTEQQNKTIGFEDLTFTPQAFQLSDVRGVHINSRAQCCALYLVHLTDYMPTVWEHFLHSWNVLIERESSLWSPRYPAIQVEVLLARLQFTSKSSSHSRQCLGTSHTILNYQTHHRNDQKKKKQNIIQLPAVTLSSNKIEMNDQIGVQKAILPSQVFLL